MPVPVHTAIIEEEVEEEAQSSELADSVADDSDEDALQEGDDVVPALPGLTGYLGSFFASATPTAGSGYAFGAQMDNPFAEMSASPFDLCRTSIDLRNRSLDLRQSVDNFRRPSDGHSSMMSACQRASIDCMGRTVEIDRCVQGVTVHDLLHLTTDPRVKKRLLKTETDEEGRISPSEILAVMSRELSTKKKLKLGVVMGGVLVLLVLLLLGANAALTFSMVALSKDSSVQSSGVLTAKDGGGVVGTATSAAMVNLLYAHHTTQESAAALLAMKSLVVNTNTSAGDTSTFVYQVLAATLVPALHLELVVTARSAAAAALDVSKLMRIYIDDKGVHEVRGGDDQGTAAAGRRLLVDAGAGVGSVQGMVSDMATNMCGPSTSPCSPITTQMSCPAVQTCGMDGLPYASPCAARSAGTVVRCTNCPLVCTTSTATAGPDQQGRQQEQQAAAEVTAVNKAAVGTAAVDQAAAAAEQARTEQQQEGQGGIGLEEPPQFAPVDVGVTNTLDASLRFSVMSWAADTAWVPALQGFRISLLQETAVAGQYLPIPGWTHRELVTKLDAAHPTLPPRLQVSASTDGSQKTYYRLDAVLKGPFPTSTRGGGSRVRFEVASVRLDGTVSRPVTVESTGGRR